MTCEALFNRMGFECRELSPGVFRVFTPLSLSDGEPISLYLVESGNTVRVSDNGNTLFHMRGIGLDVDDRKKWRGVTNILASFKLNLESTGEVTGLTISGSASESCV